MKKLFNSKPLPLLLAILLVVATVALAGTNNRFSGINLGSQAAGGSPILKNVLEIPRMSMPTQSQTPPKGYIWLYAREQSGETILRIRDENGADGLFTITSYVTD